MIQLSRAEAGSGRSVAGRRLGRRGLTPISSMVVVVVVLALVGVSAYGIMGGFSPAPTPSCQPSNSPGCNSFLNVHDLTVVVPFQSVQQGTPVPFTVTLPSGESASSYSYAFGDGTPVNHSSSPTMNHAFAHPGVYLVGVQALVQGTYHDNYHNLIQIKVNPSFAADANQSLPGISGSVAANSTSSPSSPPTAVLQPGQTVTLSAQYTNSPSNPSYVEVPPSVNLSAAAGATVVGKTLLSTNVTESLRFANPGTYTVTMVGGSTLTNSSNPTHPSVYQNFTWTVFVAEPTYHAGILGAANPRSPHPGTILVYELAPGGARTEDPAIAYDTVSAEPIQNIYQTLISYNGSDVGPTYQSFVPVLATCVPGSPQCLQQYGSSLINGTNYTFVISSAPQFYDPQTQNHWGVYPSDVVFSIARTLGFSTLPCVSCNNGWILGQSLLFSGNATWDTIHESYNNTPQGILDSMTVNGSLCPSEAMASEHGCVTFNADGQHRAWPYFLELIADELGGSIVPCGWFSAQAQDAGIPYWTAGNSTGNGDHPCQMPGVTAGGTTWGRPVSQIPYQGWDQWETIGSGDTGRYGGKVQYNMVGSGPYFMAQYEVGLSYELQANPDYASNPDCTWSGCYPAAGSYAKLIEVTWETDPTQGEQALASGVADFASVPSTDLSLLLQLISEGKVNAISAPTLNLGFIAFTMSFNLQGAERISTQPVTVQSDFLGYLGMRQFLVHSYPYATIQQTINTKDGIQLGFNYGGAIPQFMGNYYPTNIAWPSGDPCTDASNPSCAAYWWNSMHDPTSPYFDPQVLSCSSGNPCEFPLIGQTGNPEGDIVNALWVKWISQLSGGAIVATPVDLNFATIVTDSTSSSPGQNPLPMYGLGWAPDYPDPTDYVQPLYLANSTYTYSDAVAQSLFQSQFGTGCPAPASDYSYYANLTTPVSQACQAVAYKAMLNVLGQAAYTPAGPLRAQLYDEAEKIANQLALYLYTSQANAFSSAAAWININSINENVTTGAGGIASYFSITGNGVA